MLFSSHSELALRTRNLLRFNLFSDLTSINILCDIGDAEAGGGSKSGAGLSIRIEVTHVLTNGRGEIARLEIPLAGDGAAALNEKVRK